MSMPWAVVPASGEDVEPIASLLRENALPDNDLGVNIGDFFVARQDDNLIGTAGMERYGRDALLRSVAVARAWRDHGVAQALLDAVLHHARSAGFVRLYLLTQTAEGYFARHGFERIERATLPAGVSASAQVQTLCPASAKVMVRSL